MLFDYQAIYFDNYGLFFDCTFEVVFYIISGDDPIYYA